MPGTLISFCQILKIDGQMSVIQLFKYLFLMDLFNMIIWIYSSTKIIISSVVSIIKIIDYS